MTDVREDTLEGDASAVPDAARQRVRALLLDHDYSTTIERSYAHVDACEDERSTRMKRVPLSSLVPEQSVVEAATSSLA
jgi:hypothetical protein